MIIKFKKINTIMVFSMHTEEKPTTYILRARREVYCNVVHRYAYILLASIEKQRYELVA